MSTKPNFTGEQKQHSNKYTISMKSLNVNKIIIHNFVIYINFIIVKLLEFCKKKIDSTLRKIRYLCRVIYPF